MALAVMAGAQACETYTDGGGYDFDEDDGMSSTVYVYCYADMPEDFLADATAYLTGVFTAAPPTGGIGIAFRQDIDDEFDEPEYEACPAFSSAGDAHANRAERVNAYHRDGYDVVSLDWTYN